MERAAVSSIAVKEPEAAPRRTLAIFPMNPARRAVRVAPRRNAGRLRRACGPTFLANRSAIVARADRMAARARVLPPGRHRTQHVHVQEDRQRQRGVDHFVPDRPAALEHPEIRLSSDWPARASRDARVSCGRGWVWLGQRHYKGFLIGRIRLLEGTVLVGSVVISSSSAPSR